jgi:deoxyribodipyrimidine photo-lyase
MTNTKDDHKNISSYGIHWFRRDLRVFGNPALRENWKINNGRVLGIFCFDSNFLKRSDFSHNRFAFFLNTLRSLKSELKAQGGDLLVIDSLPDQVFDKLLGYLKKSSISYPNTISWNKDYEPFARQRDQKIELLLKSYQIETVQKRDHLIFEPHEVLKSEKENDFYQIYTPYAKKWFSLLKTKEIQNRISSNKGIEKYYADLEQNKFESTFRIQWRSLFVKNEFPFTDSLDSFIKKNNIRVTIPIPEAGSAIAFAKLKTFKNKIATYKDDRDLPIIEGTSKLSMFLKNGSISSSQIIYYLSLQQTDFLATEQEAGCVQFLKEIVWREFYYSILWHQPRVEHQSFLQKYEAIKWQNNKQWFELWKEGKTGFPIVDAGMRELKQTGWMHNRVRMIVASFLTKDLLIDWRWGEKYFMETLLDGDLAANNGGWQWAASTGCDPQPYFRIFNPWLQSEKFDKDGLYIKKYIPELKTATAKILHSANADRSQWNYPRPIVDHSEQRDKALRLYKNL